MSLQSAQRQHIEAILQYVESDSTLAFPGQALIGRSWKRCLNDYGLDPSQPREARIVTHQILREHQDSVDEFLNVARAGVEQLHSQITGMGYVLLLTDHRGITVQFLGDKRHDRRLRQAGLYLGADWNEQYAGTCAVGTCIAEKLPLTCHRVDHFDATHISLTCTATPITDPQGNLLGVLDISALDSPNARHSQNFAMHLTQLYARMIEDAYFRRIFSDSLIFRCDPSREFVQINAQCLFAIDTGGVVIAANTNARRLLDQAKAGAYDWKGSLLSDVFDCEMPDIWTIPYDNKDQVRAFQVRSSGETLFASLIEPRHIPVALPDPEHEREKAVPALDGLADDDPVMRRTLSLAKRFRNRDVGLLILGETGTGKEVLAKAIHDSSRRADKSFIAVNCAAIPESLIESELFGYAAGAFTGARPKGMSGLIQQAHGGTLFLDEIGDMPLQLQTRLLRVLAEGEIFPLGADKPLKVDCRIIAATHQDIASLVDAGKFRADLYYRLNGAILRLPPLRQRADKQFVIRSVLRRLIETRMLPEIGIRADAMSAMLACPWPGNIRQLTNALTFAEATSDGIEITTNDLPEECLDGGPAPAAGLRCDEPETAPSCTAGANTSDALLAAALQRKQWNVSAVARELGISRPTVYRRMRQEGLVSPNRR
ncbi:MAG: sigma-54-dependent Fis family transcriptional regulator [Marinobacter sp.]|uniref:sigma-54-dependent Fis family transcriptional regulator n=1 Tax=Marinobacter sp. TaxID=50741 RepID=UPI0034A02D21